MSSVVSPNGCGGGTVMFTCIDLVVSQTSPPLYSCADKKSSRIMSVNAGTTFPPFAYVSTPLNALLAETAGCCHTSRRVRGHSHSCATTFHRHNIAAVLVTSSHLPPPTVTSSAVANDVTAERVVVAATADSRSHPGIQRSVSSSSAVQGYYQGSNGSASCSISECRHSATTAEVINSGSSLLPVSFDASSNRDVVSLKTSIRDEHYDVTRHEPDDVIGHEPDGILYHRESNGVASRREPDEVTCLECDDVVCPERDDVVGGCHVSGDEMALAVNGENALDLTAPASDALLRNRKNTWIQLAGHAGCFAPAGPQTIWKKQSTDNSENCESTCYRALMNDSVQSVVPKFYRQVEFNDHLFIEMEDLLQHFADPSIMDVKMGTRTFLESEVKNEKLRPDLYNKMISIDPNEPTPEEHAQAAVTKLRYMQLSGEPSITDLQKVSSRDEVISTIVQFVNGHNEFYAKYLARLKEIRRKFEESRYFKHHEIIGSSLLFLYDAEHNANIWIIDFAKTLPVKDHSLSHRAAWSPGNHEDGFLLGMDNIIDIMKVLCRQHTVDSNQKSRGHRFLTNLFNSSSTYHCCHNS